MSLRRKFKVDKLVRDKTKERLHAKGVICVERVMETAEYLERLKDKLIEEAHEVVVAKTPEECLSEYADVLEVLYALAETMGFSPAAIEKKRLETRAERGGFDRRVYHESIEMDADNKNIDYVQGLPHKYPEID